MNPHDERIDYYLMVTRLMAEADAQLDADAGTPSSLPYAEDLELLREAVQMAEQAAARIVVSLVTTKRARIAEERLEASPNARH